MDRNSPMKDREIYKMMGAPTASPADGDALGVMQGGFGLVTLREDGPGFSDTELSVFVGKVGYYDDDAWEPNDPEAWHALSENEADEVDDSEHGTDFAIVYFCKPFAGPYYLIPYGWLRPATAEEALAYSLSAATLDARGEGEEEEEGKGLSEAIAYLDEKGKELSLKMLESARSGEGLPYELALVTIVSPDGKRNLITCNMEYGDGEGLSMASETAVEAFGGLQPGETIEVRIHVPNQKSVISDSYIVKMDPPLGD